MRKQNHSIHFLELIWHDAVNNKFRSFYLSASQATPNSKSLNRVWHDPGNVNSDVPRGVDDSGSFLCTLVFASAPYILSRRTTNQSQLASRQGMPGTPDPACRSNRKRLVPPNVGTRSCKTTFNTNPFTICDIFWSRYEPHPDWLLALYAWNAAPRLPIRPTAN